MRWCATQNTMSRGVDARHLRFILNLKCRASTARDMVFCVAHQRMAEARVARAREMLHG